MALKYEVGDAVTIVSVEGLPAHADGWVGHEGGVIAVDPYDDELPYRVNVPSLGVLWMHGDNLEGTK